MSEHNEQGRFDQGQAKQDQARQDQARQCQFDIVIVGGGIVGASLACALVQTALAQGVRIALVEKYQAAQCFEGKVFDPRVVALNASSIDFFTQLGVWPSIEAKRTCAYTKMFVWDGEGTQSIRFDARDVHAHQLGVIAEHSVLMSELYSHLNRLCARPTDNHRGRFCLYEAELEHFEVEQRNGRPCSTLSLSTGQSINAHLVLAADGAESTLAKKAGFAMRAWDYQQTAIVTTVKHERPHENTAWQRFSATGPLAFLPLSLENDDQKKYSSIVWSLDTEHAEKIKGLDDRAFCLALERAFESKLGKIEDVAKRFDFPLQQSHAKKYIRDGIALLGDAAHRIHPLAGQGVNLGLSDALVLVEEIQRALARGIELDDFSMLQRYQRRRRGENLVAMAVMETFKRMFASELPALVCLRNLGLAGVDVLKPLKQQLISLAQGIKQ